jgi:hypothetical protein
MDNISFNYKIISASWIGKDKEGSGHGLFLVYSWHLPVWTEKKNKNYSPNNHCPIQDWNSTQITFQICLNRAHYRHRIYIKFTEDGVRRKHRNTHHNSESCGYCIVKAWGSTYGRICLDQLHGISVPETGHKRRGVGNGAVHELGLLLSHTQRVWATRPRAEGSSGHWNSTMEQTCE